MKAKLARTVASLVVMLSSGAVAFSSSGKPQFTISIKDLPAALAPLQVLIKTHLLTAAKMWTEVIESKPCSIEIVFSIRDVVEGDSKKLGYGKSNVAATFGDERINGKFVSEQGLASELRTGHDPNNKEPDVEICFQSAYVMSEFWWDPDPTARKEVVPPRKLDALSVILHEFGHALAFNGWIDPKSGNLAGSHMSTYDRYVLWDGHDFFFQGPAATKIYGKPILLARSLNNYHHLGDKRSDIPTDSVLQNDLMTGYNFQWGKRYSVTLLDIAILKDCGIQTRK